MSPLYVFQDVTECESLAVKESGAFLLDNSLSVTIDLPLGGVKCSKSV